MLKGEDLLTFGANMTIIKNALLNKNKFLLIRSNLDLKIIPFQILI